MRRKKKVDKLIEAEKYYTKHQKEIDATFGGKKDWLDTVKYNIRQDYYYSPRNAKLDFKDLIISKKGGDSELLYAKRNATNKDIYFPDGRALNKKIDQFSAIPSNASWSDSLGFDKEVKQYYEIKGSNLVLANIITTEPGGGSPVETWEYIDKSYV